MLNIIHTVASIDPVYGGPSRSVPGLAQALQDIGVRSRVHPWDTQAWPDETPGIVHDHGIWLPENHRTARMARKHGITRVVSVRGMLRPSALDHKRLKKRLAWLLFQRRDLEDADAIHVTSQSEAGDVRRAGLKNPLIMVPNGVRFPHPLPRRSGSERRQALFLSRLHPNKGARALLQAWRAVNPEGWDLAIAGPDPSGYRRELERIACSSGLGNRVAFIGEVSDADKWVLYRSSDLFILPTHSESFGLVVAEALAAEIPVITTRAAPWEELETDGCGWWIEVGPEPLAAALREATGLSDEERASMGRRGRDLITQNYSWRTVAERMRRAYTWLLTGGELPACVFLH